MKWLIVICIIIFSSSCFNLEDEKNIKTNSSISMWKDYYYDAGMKYSILRDKSNGELVIVNLTRDSLECEYLKKNK